MKLISLVQPSHDFTGSDNPRYTYSMHLLLFDVLLFFYSSAWVIGICAVVGVLLILLVFLVIYFFVLKIR